LEIFPRAPGPFIRQLGRASERELVVGQWGLIPDKSTSEVVESYTMLTINADDHPLMSRMHRPDPMLPVDQQDKRSVVAIEQADVATWLLGDLEAAARLVRPAAG